MSNESTPRTSKPSKNIEVYNVKCNYTFDFVFYKLNHNNYTKIILGFHWTTIKYRKKRID